MVGPESLPAAPIFPVRAWINGPAGTPVDRNTSCYILAGSRAAAL
jgi:hypothetical protein